MKQNFRLAMPELDLEGGDIHAEISRGRATDLNKEEVLKYSGRFRDFGTMGAGSEIFRVNPEQDEPLRTEEDQKKRNAKDETLLALGTIFATFGAFGSGLAFGEIQQEFSTKYQDAGNHYTPEAGAIIMGLIGVIGAFVFLSWLMVRQRRKLGNTVTGFAIFGLVISGLCTGTGLVLSTVLKDQSEACVKGCVYGTLIAGAAIFAITMIFFLYKRFHFKVNGNGQQMWMAITSVGALIGGAVYSGIMIQDSLYDKWGSEHPGMGAHAYGIGALFVIGFICLGWFMTKRSWKAQNGTGHFCMMLATVSMAASGAFFAYALSQPTLDNDNFGALDMKFFIVAGALLVIGVVLLLLTRTLQRCKHQE